MNFATPKVYFPANQMFEFLVHARKPKCGPFFANLFRYFSLPLFFSLFLPFHSQFFCPLCLLYFAWNCDWLTLQEMDKFHLQRVSDE